MHGFSGCTFWLKSSSSKERNGKNKGLKRGAAFTAGNGLRAEQWKWLSSDLDFFSGSLTNSLMSLSAIDWSVINQSMKLCMICRGCIIKCV